MRSRDAFDQGSDAAAFLTLNTTYMYTEAALMDFQASYLENGLQGPVVGLARRHSLVICVREAFPEEDLERARKARPYHLHHALRERRQ